MKKYMLCVAVLLIAIQLLASVKATAQSRKVITNIMYSPVSYNHFFGSISGMNDEYGFKEQFYDVPVKRIVMEKLYDVSSWETFWGFSFILTHNRINTGHNPYGGIEYEKKGTSITTLSFGFTHVPAISFISKQLFLKMTIALSIMQIWRKEVNSDGDIGGTYIDIGLRYVFSSESKYKFNVGIDFSYSDTFLKHENAYKGIALGGIYPYVGIMW